MKMLSRQYGNPATNKIKEKIKTQHHKTIEEIPRSRFLTSVNPILKRQFNCNFEELLGEFLKSQKDRISFKNIEFRNDSEQFSIFLKVIGDPSCVSILTAVDEKTTIQKISYQTGLSIPTIYRKIEKLYDVGLVVKILAKFNAKQILYSKTICHINLEISQNGSRIVIVPKKEPMYLQRILYLI